jgi:hypothetical protein
MTVSAPSPQPQGADEDRLVQRHAEQHRALGGQVADAQARVAALIQEQMTLRAAEHERSVSALLGHDAPSEDHGADRLSQIDGEIAMARAGVNAAQDALERHSVIAAGVREQAQRKFESEVRGAAHAVLERMVAHGDQLLALTEQLQQLVSLCPGGLLVPISGFLETWVKQARALEAEYGRSR